MLNLNKSFTLIEMIISILVIGLLLAIVIPNIYSEKDNATRTAIESNTKSIQLAADTYAIQNSGDNPTVKKADIYNPQPVDYDKLHPTNLMSLPKVGLYSVDFQGKVWGNTVGSVLNTTGEEDELSWEQPPEAKGFVLYEVENFGIDNRTASVGNDFMIRANAKKLKITAIKEPQVDSKNGVVRFTMDGDKEYLISTIDQYGLESAPTGINYNGDPVLNDEKENMLEKTGTFYLTTNANEKAIWDGIEVLEEKPEGTDIKYSFATSNNGKDYSEFAEDIHSLGQSQYLKVKVNMTSANQSKPSLIQLKVMFHLSKNKNSFVPINLFDDLSGYENIDFFYLDRENTTTPEGLQLVDETNVGIIENITDLGAIKIIGSIDCECITPSGGGIKIIYQTSVDGVYWSTPTTHIGEVPAGRYVKTKITLTRSEYTSGGSSSPIVKSINIQLKPENTKKNKYVPPALVKVPVSEEFIEIDKEFEKWITLDESYIVIDNRDSGTWTSVEAIDYQPDGTRIIYVYSISNDEKVWSNHTGDLTNLPDSRYLRVDVIRQVLETAIEEPVLYELIVNYKLKDGTKGSSTHAPSGQMGGIQQAVNKYKKATNTYPTVTQPTVILPEKLNFNLLTPNYLNTVPSNLKAKYWVTFEGRVFMSMVDSPQNVVIQNRNVSWDKVAGAMEYKIYALNSNGKLGYVGKTTDASYKGILGVDYYISSVDSQGNASAPVGPGYKGFNTEPTAVIGMTPNDTASTKTNILWTYSNSIDPDGDSIVNAEWMLDGVLKSNPNGMVATAGNHIMKLRVQDENGAWSDWTSKSFTIYAPIEQTISGKTDGSLQSWIVPKTGLYKITAYGAQGGNGGNGSGRIGDTGGNGNSAAGTMFLNQGDTLSFKVGMRGQAGSSGGSGTYASGGGGAGGGSTGVLINNKLILHVKGGSGGTGGYDSYRQYTTSGVKIGGVGYAKGGDTAQAHTNNYIGGIGGGTNSMDTSKLTNVLNFTANSSGNGRVVINSVE